MNAFPILPEKYFLLNDSIIVRTICAALLENFFLLWPAPMLTNLRWSALKYEFDCNIKGLSRDSCKMKINLLYSTRERKQELRKTSRK